MKYWPLLIVPLSVLILISTWHWSPIYLNQQLESQKKDIVKIELDHAEIKQHVDKLYFEAKNNQAKFDQIQAALDDIRPQITNLEYETGIIAETVMQGKEE